MSDNISQASWSDIKKKNQGDTSVCFTQAYTDTLTHAHASAYTQRLLSELYNALRYSEKCLT